MQACLRLPRRYSINAEGKCTKKPRAMQTHLFDFHGRGFTNQDARFAILSKKT